MTAPDARLVQTGRASPIATFGKNAPACNAPKIALPTGRKGSTVADSDGTDGA